MVDLAEVLQGQAGEARARGHHGTTSAPGQKRRCGVREVRLRASGIFRCVTYRCRGEGKAYQETNQREQLQSDDAKRVHILGYDFEHLDYVTESGRH